MAQYLNVKTEAIDSCTIFIVHFKDSYWIYSDKIANFAKRKLG